MNHDFESIITNIRKLNKQQLSFEERFKRTKLINAQKLQLLPTVDFTNGKDESTRIIDCDFSWNSGAPIPHVISDGYRTYLVFALYKHDMEKIILTDDENSYDCALIEFDCLYDYRFGGVNIDVLEHHPLKNLDYCRLHEVNNSKWLAMLHKANAYHCDYNPDHWLNIKHYFFTFHDETFECLAKGYKIEIYQGYMNEVAKIAFDRLFN